MRHPCLEHGAILSRQQGAQHKAVREGSHQLLGLMRCRGNLKAAEVCDGSWFSGAGATGACTQANLLCRLQVQMQFVNTCHAATVLLGLLVLGGTLL